MPAPNSDRDPVEVLATEFVERIRRGERPTVKHYTTEHPALAEKINRLFPTIARMEQLKAHQEHSSGTAVSLGGPRPDKLGDFRIVREVGRGGMGIVYEAEQKSLERRVAVKVLPQSSLVNPRQLRRFHREAQTAAGLHHGNIVPVFGVGEESGNHYIVMQLIPGFGLDEILSQLAEHQRAESPETDIPATTAGGNSSERIEDVVNVVRMLVHGDIEYASSPDHSVRDATRIQGAEDTDAGIDQDTSSPQSPTMDFGVEAAATVEAGSDSASRRQDMPTWPSEPLRIGPTYWRNVARIGIQVADAMGYAHGRNVLHRDVKPANLIIDRQGVAWVSDFGLARAMEDDSVSRSGDIVGTLRYMAPERLHGKADARSDIFSLGLTLYEMLALRPAYDETDASSLLRKIANEPPPRLASAVPEIHRDLETIVMKAIAREPAHRYQSARALAEDLRLFLEDRPIHARRVSSVERLWRWCRRNRAVASLAATALTLLVLVAVVASIGYVRTSIANTKVTAALAGESRQRRKAETSSHLAQEALDEIFRQFAPGRAAEFDELSLDGSSDGEIQVPVQPVLSKEVAGLLEHLLVFYDRLAAEVSDDADLRRKTADANRRVGDIRGTLGQFEQAQAAYLRAIDGYRKIEEGTPGDVTITTEIARIYNNLGNLRVAASEPVAGRTFHMDALNTLDGHALASDASPAARYEMARSCYFLGRDVPPEMTPGAPQQHTRPPRRGPPRKPPRGDPESSRTDHIGRENEQYLRRAIGLLEKLAEEQTTVPDYKHLLACCYRDLPTSRSSDPEGVLPEQTRRAIDILEQLAKDCPAVPVYQHDLAKTYRHAVSQRGGVPHLIAEIYLRKALEITQKLVAEHPNVPDYAASQVQTLFALSETLRHNRRVGEAEPELREALSIQSSLVSRYPDVVPYKAWKAIIQDALAKLLGNRGRMEEACSLLKASTATLHAILETEREAPYVDRLLKRSYDNLADVYRRLGERDLADAALRQAERYRDDRKPPPRPPRD